MYRSTLLVLAAVACMPGLAYAQDLVAVAPELAKVEYEDARVRVVRLHIPAHGALPMHDRPRRVVVSLTANHVQLTRADGTTSITRTEAGTFAWSESAVRSVVNLGEPVENIVIELKQASEPARPVSAPPADRPSDFLSESRHRWAFENQYVRVYDVRIPPGETTELHRHAYDQVTVYVTGGLTSGQQEGQPWGPAANVMPRRVTFSAYAAEPIAHRVRNDGTAEYRTILVQFLR